jgi:ribosomal protein L37AE/L43A
VEDYNRYYCYGCEEYLPKDLKPPGGSFEQAPADEAEEEEAAMDVPACPKCSKPATWVENYKRYYCYGCEEYLPKDALPDKASPAEEKEEVAAPEAPPPEEEKKDEKPACPKCNKEATFIDQYKRYYCHGCKEYLPNPAPQNPGPPKAKEEVWEVSN